MRLVIQSDGGGIDAEADSWFHGVVRDCFPWMQVNLEAMTHDKQEAKVVLPVKRGLVRGPGRKRLLWGLIGTVHSPARMEYVDALLTVRDVVRVEVASTNGVSAGFEELDCPVSLSSENPHVLMIGTSEWPHSGWMLQIEIQRLDIELSDNFCTAQSESL